jgi:hypothetical protein
MWREVLLEGLEDWHGLWWICGYFEHLPGPMERRRRTLEFVRELLDSGLFEAGFPTRDGCFEAWVLTPPEAVVKIDAEWTALGTDPSLGDVVWFNLTEAGEREAKRIKESVQGGSA